MSWPIGYTNPGLRFRATLDGTIYAQDVQVTAASGWMVVAIPESASKPGSVDVAVRLRLSVDSHGHPFLYAEELECRGRQYPGVFALIRDTGAEWVEPLRRCVFMQIARRVEHAPAPAVRDVRRADASGARSISGLSADDTWPATRVPGRNAPR